MLHAQTREEQSTQGCRLDWGVWGWGVQYPDEDYDAMCRSRGFSSCNQEMRDTALSVNKSRDYMNI